MASEFRPSSKILSAGRSHRFCHHVATASTRADCRSLLLAAPSALTVLPFGAGQSLGDSCLNGGGGLILTRGMRRVLHLDKTGGLITSEPGLTIGQLAGISLASSGERCWFPPVFPGSAAVTLGGAIANDIHGKNHSSQGSFCHHLENLTLMRSDGSIIVCDAHNNCDLFRATIGGLGLTGVIVAASLRMRTCLGPLLESEDMFCDTLPEALRLFIESDKEWEYRFYWLDPFDPAGRGIFTRSRHCAGLPSEAESPSLTMRAIARIPLPAIVGGPALWRTWYKLFFSRKLQRRLRRKMYSETLTPLGNFPHWNRLLGPRGLLHQQSVVPISEAPRLLLALLEDCRNMGESPCLASIKLFGPHPPLGFLSFPREGFTIALDFANRGEATRRALKHLEARILEAGGAIYPAKDSTLSPDAFRRSFPSWERFIPHIDPRFSSNFWRRVGGNSPPVAQVS